MKTIFVRSPFAAALVAALLAAPATLCAQAGSVGPEGFQSTKSIGSRL